LKKALRPQTSPMTLCPTRIDQQFHPNLLLCLFRSYNMPHRNCRKAARSFSSRRDVLFPVPSASGHRLFGRTTRVRPSSESCASLRGQAAKLRRDSNLSRCRHKACVFPAQPGAHGECAYHRRQSVEPGCFQSLQPSFLLLDQARFGLPDTEPDDGRVQDRNRLAAERVRFMLGEAI